MRDEEARRRDKERNKMVENLRKEIIKLTQEQLESLKDIVHLNMKKLKNDQELPNLKMERLV